MKRLIFLLLLIVITNCVFGQGTFPNPVGGSGLPVKQYIGSDSTQLSNRGIFWSKFGLVNGIFTDTTAANTTRIDQYGGAQIFTTSDTSIWLRTPLADKWIKPPSGSGSITSFNFISDSTLIICYTDGTCDTISLINFNNIVNNIVNNNNVNVTTNGDTLIICPADTTQPCDTIIFDGGDINNYYFLDDTTLVICPDTTILCANDTCVIQQDCDTITVPAVRSLVFQSGIERTGAIVQFGTGMDLSNPIGNPNVGNPINWLIRPTTLNTFVSPFTVTGFPVWKEVVMFYQQQNWGISTDIITLLSSGSRGAIDSLNSVKLHFGYSGNDYENGTIDSGYYLQDIGYTISTNLSGRGSYGIGTDNPISKWSTIFFNTLDTTNTAVLTFYGGRPPLTDLMDDPLENPDANRLLWDRKILSLRYTKGASWHGYTSSGSFVRADSANVKPLTVDADGNMYRSFWFGSGGTVTASEGLIAVGTDVQLGATSAPGSVFTATRYINASTFQLAITGSISSQTFKVTNTNDDGTAIYGIGSGGFGVGVTGESANNVGIYGNGGVVGVYAVTSQSSGFGSDAINTGGGVAGRFTVQATSTNTKLPIVRLYRTTTGTAGNGISGSIEMYLEAADASFNIANEIISEFTTAAVLTRNSKLTITGVNSGSLVDKMYITHAATQMNSIRFSTDIGASVAAAGDLTLGVDGNVFVISGNDTIDAITTANWQSGTSTVVLEFTGTPVVMHNTAGGAGTAAIILAGGENFSAAAGDALVLYYNGTNWHEQSRVLAVAQAINARNGLSVLNSYVELGGTLYKNTTVNTAGFSTTWTGNNTGTTFSIINASSGGGLSVQVSSNIAISGGSNDSYGLFGYRTPAALNTVVGVLKLDRGSQGGTPLAGVGGAIDFFNVATTGSFISNKFIWTFTEPTTASRISKYYITGIFNASEDTLYEAGGSINLTEGAATTFQTATVGSNTTAGGEIVVSVEALDATEEQKRTLRFIWAAVNNSGTTTITIETPVEVVAVSSGTLTATITAVDGGSGLIHFQANATSSLTQTSLRATCHAVKNY